MTTVLDETDELDASRAPLIDHLNELRQRLIHSVLALAVAFGVAFAFSDQLFRFLTLPFDVAGQIIATQKAHGGHQGPFDLVLALIGQGHLDPSKASTLQMIYTEPMEFFFVKVKLAGFAGLALSFPVIGWQLYRFIAPGLYRHERMAFAPFLVASPFLFLMGAALVYFLILPMVLWFSLSQQITGTVNVQLLPKVSDYLNLVTNLIMAFGLCFQLPIVLALLAMAGIVKSTILVQGRRFAIVGIVILAAVVTPPDPISQILLSLPLLLLFEASIWVVRLIEHRRAKEDALEQD